jgi:hypothetical protein
MSSGTLVGTIVPVMAHIEILSALIAFFGLLIAWFAVPSSPPVRARLSTADEVAGTEAVPSAA